MPRSPVRSSKTTAVPNETPASGVLTVSSTDLRAVLDDVSDGFSAFDREWRVTYLNRASANVLGRIGRDANGLIGKVIWEEFPDLVGTPIHDAYLQAMSERTNVELEQYYAPLDSWFQIRLYPSSDGLLSYSHDITLQKRAEVAVREQQRINALSADIGKALTAAASLHEMLQGCTEAIVRHLDAAFARIWTVDESERLLVLRASAGMYTHLDGPHGRVPIGSFKIGLIAEERKPHLTNQVVGDARVGDQEWARREEMVAFAGYPLVVEEKLVGVAAMFARHTLTDSVLAALAAVSDEIGLGIVRKQAEESVRAGREWLDTTLRSIGDAVIAADAQGRVTLVNGVAEALTGFTQSEAAGRPLTEIFRIYHETTRLPVENPVDRVIREGGIVGLANHTILVSREGREVAIDDSAAPIKGPGGELQGVVLVFRDVTRQRTMERYAVAQHRVSAELAGSTSLAEASRAVLRVIGETLGWKVGLLWKVDVTARTLCVEETWRVGGAVSSGFEANSRGMVFRSGEGLPGEVLATGRVAWVEQVSQRANFARKAAAAAEDIQSAIAFPLMSKGQILGVIELYSDQICIPDDELLRTLGGLGNQIGQFLERRRAEETVRESETLKSAILNEALDCIISMDESGRVIEWNRRAEETFGYSREEALGQEMATLIIPAAYRDRHREGLARYLATGDGPILGKRLELTGMHRNGTEFSVELAVNRISTEPPCFTGFIRDISDQVRNRADLQQAAESLRQEQERQVVMMRYLRAANRAAASMASLIDPHEIACSAVESMQGEFGARITGVWLYDISRQRLILTAGEVGDPPPLSLSKEIDVLMNAYKIGWVARYGRPYVGPILAADLQFEQTWAAQRGVTWAAVYPLKSRETLHGVLAGFFAEELPLGGSDVLATLSAIVSGSLETSRLVRDAG